VHLAYIWIVSHLSAKNYRNWWKFDEVLTKTNLLSFFGTRCSIVTESVINFVIVVILYVGMFLQICSIALFTHKLVNY